MKNLLFLLVLLGCLMMPSAAFSQICCIDTWNTSTDAPFQLLSYIACTPQSICQGSTLPGIGGYVPNAVGVGMKATGCTRNTGYYPNNTVSVTYQATRKCGNTTWIQLGAADESLISGVWYLYSSGTADVGGGDPTQESWIWRGDCNANPTGIRVTYQYNNCNPI